MHLFRATVSVDTRRAINDHTKDSLMSRVQFQSCKRTKGSIITGVQGELIVPLHL
jgi:hypothetical protein